MPMLIDDAKACLIAGKYRVAVVASHTWFFIYNQEIHALSLLVFDITWSFVRIFSPCILRVLAERSYLSILLMHLFKQ